jgi:glycosyltransferase involved in cell wall biosynthesis
VIEHGVSGFLHPPDDTAGMADSAVALLSDAALHRRMAAAARTRVETLFCTERVVPMYEAYYRQVIDGPAVAAR